MIYPYIRGTDRKYGTPENGGFWGENGYNCIEVGYLVDGEDGVWTAVQLTPCADSIELQDFMAAMSGNGIRLSIDCVDDGYLRIFADYPLKWRGDTSPLSTMMIERGEPTASLFEEKEQ